MATKEYITTTGQKLIIHPISQEYLSAIQRGIDYPPVPTYEVDVLGGGTETVEHTEVSEKSERDQELWNDYKLMVAEANTLFYRKKAKAIIRKCVEVEMPEDDEWITLQEEDGIEVPKDNPSKLRFHYIETECLSSATDVFAIVDAAEVTSRFDAEEYQAAINSFRNILEGDAS